MTENSMNYYSFITKEVKFEFLRKTLKFTTNLLRIFFVVMLLVGFKFFDNSYIIIGLVLLGFSFVVSYVCHRQTYDIKIELNRSAIKEIRIYKKTSTKVLRTFDVNDMTGLNYNTKTSLLYFEINEKNAKIYCDKYMMYLIAEIKMKGVDYDGLQS